MYAAGKIPGGFFKREGRPTERAILTARMIDRPIRPLWPKGYRNEVQVVCTTLSADLVTPHDILCINGASAALMVSPLPFLGPVGRRPDRTDRRRVRRQPDAAGDRGGEHARPDRRRHEGRLTMVEAGADEIPEDELLEALELAHARDREDLRGPGGPAPAGRQAQVARPRAHLGARVAARRPDPRADRGRGPARGGRGRGGARRSWLRRSEHGVERGGHPPADPGSRQPRRDPRATRLDAVEGPGPRAVRGRSARADRGRAGLEGAQVGEAPAAVRPDHRGGRAAVPGRPGDGRGRGAVGQGLDDEAVREEGGRVDLQGARPREDRRRQAPPRRARRRGDPPINCEVGVARARTAPRSSPAARRRSCHCSRLGRRRRASGSTTSRWRPIAATCTTTTSRPTRSGRPASCAARSAATSATARSRSGRSSR